MTTTMEKSTVAVVQPFGIEVDHPRNCDIVIQSIPGCRMRGKIKPVVQTIQGSVATPLNQGHALPDVPGMQLHINPAKLTYAIVDPLEDDDAAKTRILNYMRMTQGISSDYKIRGVPKRGGELDTHRMKTLCREICDLLDEGHIRVVKGPTPSRDDIEDLPGKFLLNPGSRIKTGQPIYEEDYDAWVDRLTMQGG
jgi:hypothetical protein